MKKIILLLAFFALVAGVSAQETKKMDKMKDCVMMKDGKMMVMKDGKTMAMDKDMTLTDGTKVMADGKVMMKDGTTKMLKDGESLTMDGKMGKMHEKMKKKEAQ